MPYCKNCHSRIDKFNKDRCPICGFERPLDDVSSDTVEITTSVDTSDLNLDYHPRSRKKLFIYFSLLGIFGVPYFYLYRPKLGAFYCLSNLLVITGLSLILIVICSFHIALGIVLSIVAMMLINFFIGFSYYKTPNLKDGHGDFLE